MWRAVVDDQQVKEATKILKNDARSASGGGTKGDAGAKLAITGPGWDKGKAPVLAQTGRRPPATEFLKTYDSALLPSNGAGTGTGTGAGAGAGAAK